MTPRPGTGHGLAGDGAAAERRYGTQEAAGPQDPPRLPRTPLTALYRRCATGG
ncbi:hypothetical protein [Streptomyces tremellae]|uniref:hypothetical protein n=1 Tax=Streptomyces tremellae TaxID=1124239 RepID=UPI0031E5E112